MAIQDRQATEPKLHLQKPIHSKGHAAMQQSSQNPHVFLYFIQTEIFLLFPRSEYMSRVPYNFAVKMTMILIKNYTRLPGGVAEAREIVVYMVY